MDQGMDYVPWMLMLAEAKKAAGSPRYEVALSCTVSEKEIDNMQNIGENCIMTFSLITTPCSRNTFIILSASDQSLRGERLKYGEEFFLRAENYANSEDPPLYVRHTTESMPACLNRLAVRLSAIPDRNCRWRAVSLLRNRQESEGEPIKFSGSNECDQGEKGLLLGGRITTEAIEYTQELCAGCHLVGITDLRPMERTSFVLASTDCCNRQTEPLKYNQEFFLVSARSMETKVGESIAISELSPLVTK
ncbi:hypothetical protein EVAR_27040_1 [Eumeta japonica]|uniref:Uncharacterized protein n=1 Tax=Eumeta variegata TaxID=151549 RepID=A0A4C1WD87_EUMVA|nr:hypothetical protein EVAR_27040_1 [Eumeta japonica]